MAKQNNWNGHMPVFMGFHVPHRTVGVTGSDSGPQADWLRGAISGATRNPLWGLQQNGLAGIIHNFVGIFPLRR